MHQAKKTCPHRPLSLLEVLGTWRRINKALYSKKTCAVRITDSSEPLLCLCLNAL